MSFFSRPNLDNEQFKQLSGSTLTLTGTTQILNPKGLSLWDGVSTTTPTFRPIIATGGTDGDVLTLVGDEIVLLPSGAGSGVYLGTSPTTCTVGGLNAGTEILNTGLTCILQMILVPALNPTLTPPSTTFTISPSTSIYEVGSSVTITGVTCFNRGCINPQYTSESDKRSGLPNYYCYTGNIAPTSVADTNTTRTDTYTTPISYGSSSWATRVIYDEGVQPKNNEGGDFDSPLPAGTGITINRTINGIYPYFYGKIESGSVPAGSNRPTPTIICGCVENWVIGCTGTTNPTFKMVSSSNSTIAINFNSTADDYIWFAIPLSGGTAKTCWYVNALNQGTIGGTVSAGGNLFPAFEEITDVTTTCWSGQTYRVYISNYQSAAAQPMQLCN